MTDLRKGRIEIRDVSVSFGGKGQRTQAVSGVSLEVKPGDFVSVIGPSGCGKSTLLNIVAGFMVPTQGAALLDGQAIDGPGADRGVVFQQYSLFPWMTVRKNVEFGLKMQGLGINARESKARTLLGLAGLLPFENHYPDQLSGGMKQRVGIVRALATSPQVLLMDEPFGALDSQTRTVMQEILTNMWQQLQLSVLFITHDIEEAIFLSEKVYVMTARPGRIKAEIPIPLPRPRTPEMMSSPTFHALVRQLKGLIREESLAAMGGELGAAGLQGLDAHIGQDGLKALS
ncbi:ABC transporter ATP-binding protein [Piscinibacter terrae]|uniref:ABC transporter ATP-binding protein n=1 Tax=Piscinibacter terrae TaxID=2496871 RepID=A0A3N7HIC8_9BURK|nr:ABC transporter ATP-binding protein [Albitalea terrae]RQP21233.1 ABC transporter ATP-binding protein [Albitalea terrae]